MSRVLTSQLCSERKLLEGRIESLRTQHTEATRDKSAAVNKSRNLLNKVMVLEMEKEDLSHRLNDDKETTAEAKTDAKNARAEAQDTRQCAAGLELEVRNMCAYREKMESATRVEVDRAHTLFVDAYRDLGA
jgi:3-phenylpropionate/cinnamic acid dioxygenase small subunit